MSLTSFYLQSFHKTFRIMKKVCLFLLICFYSFEAKAQFYDNSAFFSGMNQLYQLSQQMIEMQNQLINYQKNNLQASLLFVPGNSSYDFGAFIMLTTTYNSWVKLRYTSAKGKIKTLIAGKDYMATGECLFILNGLSAGSKLEVIHSDTKKVLTSGRIPLTTSSSYKSFVSQTQQNMIFIANLSNSQLNYSFPTNAPTSTKTKGPICRACNGTGICGTCKGDGWYMQSYGTGKLACPNCSASNGRICSVCDGTGEW